MGLLRVLLALAVVMSHTGYVKGLPHIEAEAAVQAFFAISGFYMALVLNEKYPSSASGNRTFLVNRFLRLYPAYLVVLLAKVASVVVKLRAGGPAADALWSRYDHANPLTWLYLIASHVTMLGQDVALWLGYRPEVGAFYWTGHYRTVENPGFSLMMLPPAWSLSLELYFYLLAPFLVRRRPAILVPLTVALLVFRWGVQSNFGLFHDPWSYRFFPFELATFLLGVLMYHAYAFLKPKMRWSPPPLWAVYGVVMAALFAICAPQWSQQIFLVAPVALLLPVLFVSTKSSKIDRWIGELSYPIYISHSFVINILHQKGLDKTIPVMVATTVLAVLIVRFVEAPVDRFRQAFAAGKARFRWPSPFPVSKTRGDV